jgi:hypothetical protein
VASVTIVFGILLVLLGLIPFAITGAKTALIPAIVGAALAILGGIALSLQPGARKHVMHVAVIVGLLGFLASAGRLIGALASGKTPTTLAATSLGLMALLTGVYVVLCVRSFIAARRNRLAGAPGFEPITKT